jgi:hypothetical protein
MPPCFFTNPTLTRTGGSAKGIFGSELVTSLAMRLASVPSTHAIIKTDMLAPGHWNEVAGLDAPAVLADMVKFEGAKNGTFGNIEGVAMCPSINLVSNIEATISTAIIATTPLPTIATGPDLQPEATM